jgi:hypothetical protein
MRSIYSKKIGKNCVLMKKVTPPIVFVFLKSIVAFTCVIRVTQMKTLLMTIIVVDLEWSSYRVRDYANKKGWVLVCELISPFHDDAIAEAGDDRSSIREAYIINETFFKCVQAAPTQLQTRPLKTRPNIGNRGGGSGRRMNSSVRQKAGSRLRNLVVVETKPINKRFEYCLCYFLNIVL